MPRTAADRGFYGYFDSREQFRQFLAAVITKSLRLAYDEPNIARLIVDIGHSEALFGAPVHPHARIAVERSARSRFVKLR